MHDPDFVVPMSIFSMIIISGFRLRCENEKKEKRYKVKKGKRKIRKKGKKEKRKTRKKEKGKKGKKENGKRNKRKKRREKGIEGGMI